MDFRKPRFSVGLNVDHPCWPVENVTPFRNLSLGGHFPGLYWYLSHDKNCWLNASLYDVKMDNLFVMMHYWFSLLSHLAFEELIRLLVQEFRAHFVVSESTARSPTTPRNWLVLGAVSTGEGLLLQTLRPSAHVQGKLRRGWRCRGRSQGGAHKTREYELVLCALRGRTGNTDERFWKAQSFIV